MSLISIQLQTRREPRCVHCGEYLQSPATEVYGQFAICTPCTAHIQDAYLLQLQHLHRDTDCAQWWSFTKGVLMFTPGPSYNTKVSPLLWVQHQLHHRHVANLDQLQADTVQSPIPQK